jgi:hypothetical protein
MKQSKQFLFSSQMINTLREMRGYRHNKKQKIPCQQNIANIKVTNYTPCQSKNDTQRFAIFATQLVISCVNNYCNYFVTYLSMPLYVLSYRKTNEEGSPS